MPQYILDSDGERQICYTDECDHTLAGAAALALQLPESVKVDGAPVVGWDLHAVTCTMAAQLADQTTDQDTLNAHAAALAYCADPTDQNRSAMAAAWALAWPGVVAALEAGAADAMARLALVSCAAPDAPRILAVRVRRCLQASKPDTDIAAIVAGYLV